MAAFDTGETGGDSRAGLPSVSVVLEQPEIRALIGSQSQPLVLSAIQAVLERLRRNMQPDEKAPALDEIVRLTQRQLEDDARERLRRVVNATGIMLHTGLGRAVLPPEAAAALGTLTGCCNLQIDLETGLRGKRNYMTERLLARLTGAEAAMIVNNNAAATLLILAALCKGREVVVSRGQLIEIGGSYRLPDCVHQSGAILVEVGTTNKTHLRDYEAAIGPNTAALMRVNPSNYRMVGFTSEVEMRDLARLKQKHPLLVIDDLGCGALVDLARYGLPHEPTVRESIAAGADLVCFSGDKLIGGPQAGIIVGRKDLVQKIRKHPLTRMLRVGKLTDMALEHTLRLFLDAETLGRRHPTLRMLALNVETLEKKAQDMLARLGNLEKSLAVRVTRSESAVGGGALPGVAFPSRALAVRSPHLSADQLLARLRRHEPPIIGRIRESEVLLDIRTLLDGEDEEVLRALIAIAKDVEAS